MESSAELGLLDCFSGLGKRACCRCNRIQCTHFFNLQGFKLIITCHIYFCKRNVLFLNSPTLSPAPLVPVLIVALVQKVQRSLSPAFGLTCTAVVLPFEVAGGVLLPQGSENTSERKISLNAGNYRGTLRVGQPSISQE